MRKAFLFLSLVFLSFNLSAQVNWIYDDMKSAQAVALAEDKLIVMDFWATWCGPCWKLESNLWNLPVMQELSDNFVPLKVNVDRSANLSKRYGIKSIPSVIIATASGEVVWQSAGFGGAQFYLDLLGALPVEVRGLHDPLTAVLQKEENSGVHLELGQAFQEIGMETTHSALRSSFFSLSDKYLKKAMKKNEDTDVAQKAALCEILNDAYRGNARKALKMIQKLDENEQNAETAELKRFITAYCYKCEGEEEKLAEEKKNISNKTYLAQLEER